MEEASVLQTYGERPDFRIRQHINCQSRHVVYVVSCLRCRAQGVGETGWPAVRLQEYMRAANSINPAPFRCSIEKHFADVNHTLADLQFTLVDKLATPANVDEATLHARLVRLEELWINKVGASLNKKCCTHFSFTGYFNARAEHSIGDGSQA